MGYFNELWAWLSGSETKRAINQLETDVIALQNNLEIVVQLITFRGSQSSLKNVNDIIGNLKESDEAGFKQVKPICVLFAEDCQKRASEAVDFVEAFKSRRKSVDAVVALYNDIVKRESMLTKALKPNARALKTRYSVIEEYLKKVDDSAVKADLSAKYHEAVSKLIGIIRENDALISDMGSTLDPAIEKLKDLKKKVPVVDKFEKVALDISLFVKNGSITASNNVASLREALLKLGKLNSQFLEMQEYLRVWRDNVLPSLKEAETHLDTDKTFVTKIKEDYHRMQNELSEVIKSLQNYLKKSGKKKGGMHKIIKENIDEIRKEYDELFYVFSQMDKNKTNKHFLTLLTGLLNITKKQQMVTNPCLTAIEKASYTAKSLSSNMQTIQRRGLKDRKLDVDDLDALISFSGDLEEKISILTRLPGDSLYKITEYFRRAYTNDGVLHFERHEYDWMAGTKGTDIKHHMKKILPNILTNMSALKEVLDREEKVLQIVAKI
jgi:hypothetical protein